MRQINGGDALFLYSDKQNRHQHISLLYIYDQSGVKGGPLRFKTIMEHVRDCLGSSPIYRQRLVTVPLNLDYPYWINDPDFDLEFHVRHIALPQPGDWRQLCIQLSRLHSRPLDMTRPVWEMYVIEGLDNIDFLPKGSFAIMTKIHHIAADGVSAAELTMGLHDLEPHPATERRKVRWRPEQKPSSAQLLSRAWVNNLRSSAKTARNLGRQVSRSLNDLRSQEKAEQRPKEPTPVTRFNQEISPHRVWDATQFELADFKKIKAAVPGASINDVVLTVCGGAMRRYLQSKKELPEDLSLTSLVPVSVRSSSEEGNFGNKVHITRTSLKTLEADPLKRLALVSAEMQHVKAINAVSAREMVDTQEGLPAPTMLLAGKAIGASRGPGKTFRSQHNMIVTNVPGPQQPLYFCGARLAMFSGLAVIIDNLGISHAVTSYDGTLVIAPLADRSMMPDPAFYMQCMRKAFAELKTAALGSGADKKPVKKKKSPANVSRARKPRDTRPRRHASGLPVAQGQEFGVVEFDDGRTTAKATRGALQSAGEDAPDGSAGNGGGR
jgi:diacylglycerol O-acyltransferase